MGSDVTRIGGVDNGLYDLINHIEAKQKRLESNALYICPIFY